MIEFAQIAPPEADLINLLPAGLSTILPGFVAEGETPTVLYRDSQGTLFIEEYAVSNDVERPFENVLSAVNAPRLEENLEEIVSAGFLGLGPVVPIVNEREGERGALALPTDKDLPQGTMLETEVGIIDAGVAFWNPAFRDSEGQSRFKTVGALSLIDKSFASSPPLMPDDVHLFQNRPDAENRRDLAKLFPQSVFADTSPQKLFPTNGLAHGTAMADLVLSTARHDVDLHALELPVSVLRDLSGGQMSVVLEPALRALLEQIENHRKDQGKLVPFRAVILLAFAFTGGPLDGSADVLSGMEDVLDVYSERQYNIELILPVGNHLQDQLHAVLEPESQVGWRVLPDDHSANTVEILHGGDPSHIGLTTPGGVQVQLPAAAGLYRMHLDGRDIGAVWTRDRDDGSWNSRISLAPSASRVRGRPTAPFGRWTMSTADTDALCWVLRDETGFEADPFEPARASWLEDADYRVRDRIGEPGRVSDLLLAGGREAKVRREGTGSILASSKNAQVTVVTAQEEDGRAAHYAGHLAPGAPVPQALKLSVGLGPGVSKEYAPIGPFDGRAVLGNAGPQRFRALGTSMAAALFAGQQTHAGGAPIPHI